MRKLFQPHLPGTNNQNLYDIPFGYLSIIFRNHVKLRHKKTGGIWPPVIQRILKRLRDVFVLRNRVAEAFGHACQVDQADSRPNQTQNH